MRYVFADCLLDTQLYTLHRAGTAIRLPPKVFHVLQYLLEQRDHVVTKDELGAHVWPGQFISDATLEGAVKLARQAVGDSGRAQRLIQSRRGYGYRFVGAVAVEDRAAAAPPRQEGSSLGAAGPEDDPPRLSVGSSLARAAGVSPPAPGPTTPPSAGPPVQDPARLAQATGPGMPDAERRQLTVLFCDLVDSTVLASQLDPEDLRAVVRAYHVACAAVIQRFAGYIAQYLGDGLLVYFGYPQAQEDDAQRAVRTGLGLVAALEPLKARLEPAYGIRLAVRVGIHTGLAVVGALGEGERQEPLAIGATPNLAARLQELAAPDTVVMSAATAQLVAGYFVCQPRGAQALKGLATPVHVYEVLHESGAQTRLDVVPPRGLTPLVGREEEVALLHRRWAQATTGQGQVVLLSGEPGIGKSRLVQVLHEHVTATSQTRIVWRGSPVHQQSALSPVIAELSRRLGSHLDAPPAARLCTLEATLAAADLALAEAVPLLAALVALPLPASYPPLTLTPQRQRQRTFDILLAWLHAEARRQPVLLVVEDLHWVDPSTLELLSLLIDQSAEMRLCLVLTARAEFHPPWPLGAHLTVLALRRLTPAQVARIATHVAGDKALPPAVLQEVVRKTDGVPLCVEELTKMVLESGLLQEGEERYELTGPLPPLAIPATLHDALMARLDRLAAAKGVAQLGATIGQTFAYDLLQAVARLEAGPLQDALGQLVAADVVAQRGLPPQATYTFKHALLQEAAYHSLLRSTRQQYHQHIAQVLETRFPELVAGQPELLAHHALGGEMWEKAVSYFQQAGARAFDRAAFREAVTSFEQALIALQHFPEGHDTLRQAIDLRIKLRHPLSMLGEEQRLFDYLCEAETFAKALNDQHRQAQVTCFLSNYFWVVGDQERAIGSGHHALALAKAIGDFESQMRATHFLSRAYHTVGNYPQAIDYSQQVFLSLQGDLIQERFGLSGPLSTLARAVLVRCLADVGEFVEGRMQGEEAIRIAEAMGQPFAIMDACNAVGGLYVHQGELHRAIPILERSLEICQVWHILLGIPRTVSFLGMAYALSGRVAEALPLLAEAVEGASSKNIRRDHPLWVTHLSQAYLLAGRIGDAIPLAWRAFKISQVHQERGHQAYALRLLGEIAARREPPDSAQAEAYYQQALTLADKLGMRPLQAHCHCDLGTLYAATGQREQARAELSAALALYREMAMTFWLPQTEAVLAQVKA